MELFPGRIQSILSDACWNDYHLTLLLSEASELIISDDLKVLQILSCLELSIEGSNLAGAIQSDTGKIAIAWRNELIVLEAIDLYGKPPRWSLYYRDSLKCDCRSITWLNEEVCINFIDGRVLIYDISQKQIVWDLNAGYTYTGSFPGAQRAFSYSPGKSSSILVFCPSIGTQRKLKERPVEYTTNGHLIDSAWCVTPGLLVAQTEQACFVWDTETARLILSMPLTGAAAPVLFRTEAHTIIVRNNDQQCCLMLDQGTPHIKRESPTKNLLQLYGLRSGVSGQRFYVIDHGFLRIYSLSGKEMVAIGFIGGASPSPHRGLDTVGKYALTGSTLINTDASTILDSVVEIGHGDVLLSHFIDSKRLIALEVAPTRKQLVFYELNGNTRSWQVEGEYCALGSRRTANKEIIYLVRKDGLCEYYEFGGALVKTQSLSYSSLDLALIKNGMLLLVVSDRLELWDLDVLQSGPAWSATLGKHRAPKVLALSADCKHVCAACEDSGGSSVLYWNTRKPLCHKTLIVSRSSALSVDWSPSSDCVAILIGESIKVYGVTSSLYGLISEITDLKIEMSEVPLFTHLFSGKSNLRWTGDGQGFLLFNGRHILLVDPKSLNRLGTERDTTATSDSLKSSEITKICRKLSDPLPIYHPSILLLCLATLQPSLVLFIFQKLTTAIRLGDTNSDKKIVYLSSTLDLESLSTVNDDETNFDSERKVKLLELLRNYEIYDLTREDQDRLSKLVSASDAFKKLDAFGLYALASFLISRAGLSSVVAWIYATRSATQLQLLDIIQERIIPAESSARFFVWLDQDQLSASMDQYARKRFAEERDPTSVALYYLAHHNLSGLKALWRISSGHPEKEKTLKLLNQDFTEPRWRTAAHKNAYALLSKRRPEYAAAFFLLGESIKDCCQVCVDRLNNLELAIAVARVYDAGHMEGLNYLRIRYFSDPLGSEDDYCNTRWTQLWLDMMLENEAGILEKILDFSDLDVTTVFVYHWLGGTFRDGLEAKVRDTIESAGIPKVLGAQFMEHLTKPCSQRRPERRRETSHFDGKTKPTDDSAYSKEWKKPTRQLKKPPENLQLEPDMSAFGF